MNSYSVMRQGAIRFGTASVNKMYLTHLGHRNYVNGLFDTGFRCIVMYSVCIDCTSNYVACICMLKPIYGVDHVNHGQKNKINKPLVLSYKHVHFTLHS